MHFPKYWARGQATSGSSSASCWRWSDVSEDDARQKANQRAAELAALFASGRRLDRYSYGDRPLREEIVQRLDNGVVITRNLYGALVLNAERAMFIDVDFGDGAGEGAAIQRVQQWTASHPELAVRVYRTHAGLRLLVTNHTYDPKSAEAIALLEEVGTDKLYIQLCKAQASFRARLTPKPWRIGMKEPRVRFPYESAEQHGELLHWVSHYELASKKASVCKLLETTGPASVLDEIRPLLAYHDHVAVGDQPLA
ncbi:MAG TPA: hypothetical protein VMZ53_24815 [Kofleriaceae bacterium]|nr:hypothetical protein [Kofleriaceae bacterium]